MHLHTKALLLAGLVSLLASCGNKEEETAAEPVQQPVTRRAPVTSDAPVTAANPLDLFHTPKDDLNLPDDAQLAEGKASSIGTGAQFVSHPDSRPSVAITPPGAPAPASTPKTPTKTPTKPEDELDSQ
jgi:hypothetical protein